MAQKNRPNDSMQPLHCAMNLQDLNQQACSDALIRQIKTSNAKTICHTGSNLFTKGTDFATKGDEEMAYIYFMRFIESYKALIGKPEYKKDVKFYNGLIGQSKVSAILTRCEELGASLKKRYDLRDEVERLDLEQKRLELSEAAEENEKRLAALTLKPGKNGVITPKAKPLETSENILVGKLKNLMEQRAFRFLVVDCRFASDFTSSHLDHPNCISIPNEKLTPGLSAKKVEEILKNIPNNLNTSLIWSKRADFDMIILYDWTSSFENRDLSGAISIVYDAITKWDPSTKYKDKPRILQGGIRSIFYAYPQLLTNPIAVQEDISSKKIDSSKALEAISYPSLDQDTPNTNSASASSPRLQQKYPQTHTTSNKTNIVNNFSNGRIDTMEIDRSNKPARKLPTRPTSSESSILNVNGHSSENENGPQSQDFENSSTGKNAGDVQSSQVNGTGSAAFGNSAVNPLKSTIDVAKEYNFPESEDESFGGASFPPKLSSSIASVARPTAPKPTTSVSAMNGGPTIGRPPNESAPIPINSARLRDDSTPRNSLLKRSHSNPNFAQSLPDDMDVPKVTPDIKNPEFSRDKKPQVNAKRREFSTIESSEYHIQNDHNRTGLKNLGNTCYMNSIIQCLNHTYDLTTYFLKQNKRKEGRSLLRGDITEEIFAAIIEMNVGHRSIALNDLKSMIYKKKPAFRPNEQQDSHEFLTVIMQSMHEEIGQCTARRDLALSDKLPNLQNVPDREAADLTWNHYNRKEGTIISKLFAGLYRSKVVCANCKHASVTFDTFFVLTVTMPSRRGQLTVNHCIDASTAQEVIADFKCEGCKLQGKAFKKLDIWRLPSNLIIHLQRFYYDSYWKKKLELVDFPVECLEIASKVQGERYNNEDNIISHFQLYGVSNHYGSMESGHYTAYCRRKSSWSKYDDLDVIGMASRDVVTPAAYILFYKNLDCPTFSLE